jgi:hypothetical protein
MQDIDQNMDDLLRKAAANYPLRVNESDWDAIAGRLNQPASMPANNRRIGKYLFGIFLLLFLFTGGTFLSRGPREMKRAATTPVKHAAEPTAITSPAIKEPEIKVSNTKEREINPFNIKEPVVSTTPLITHEKKSATDHIPTHSSENRSHSTQENYTTTTDESENDPTSQHLSVQEKNARSARKPVVQAALDFKINHPSNIKTKATLPVDPNSSSKHQQKRGFYIGIAGGPEGNQIKGQQLSACGFDVGLVFGYDLNNRFSLETGVLFNRKHYFCDGQYFNLEMPGMKLESLEGKSTLFEIPLKLKYNIVHKRTWNVFSTAGLSSYVMSNENNNYQLVVNGTRQNMLSNYENVSKYFAAAVDLSVGYEFKPNRRLRLRLQPYLQLPLKGIGVGSIPVQSMGVHAGIIRSFR